MEVVVLGSGTAVPTADRFPAGYFVRIDGRSILVDLGPGVLRRFAQAGGTLDSLDAVLLTHYHTDHCADLSALLFALRNPRFADLQQLALRGAPGLEILLDAIGEAWPWCRREPIPALDVAEVSVAESGKGQFNVAGLSVDAFAIEHTDASLGYRFTAESGVTAAFSGDATYCSGVIALATGVDFFVCDAAFPADCPTPGHMTTVEAGRVAAEAGVKTLCLTHFYPECDGHDLRAEAASEFDGEILLAADLWSFDLESGRYAATMTE